MNGALRRARRLAVALAGASALAGCAFSPQLGQVAVDHNKMVARSTDELTLLNVIRASQRFPLHFTTITEVTGNAQLSLDAELLTRLSPGPDPAALDTATGLSTSPSFRATVLATEDFQRGIQSPVEAGLVAYYLDAGWRDELIMALMVERIDAYRTTSDAKPVFSIVNNEERGSDFASVICSHGLVSEPSSSAVPLASFAQLIDLEKVSGESASPDERRKEINALLDLLANEGVALIGETLHIKGSENTVRIVRNASNRCAASEDNSRLDGLILRPRFRSTLGMIYFLGEYQREREEKGAGATYLLPRCSEPCTRDNLIERPLIAIRTGSGEALVETEFRGKRYFVGAQEAGRDPGSGVAEARSLQVLALIEQLVNLQKSADTLPASLNVTGIN